VGVYHGGDRGGGQHLREESDGFIAGATMGAVGSSCERSRKGSSRRRRQGRSVAAEGESDEFVAGATVGAMSRRGSSRERDGGGGQQ